MNPFSRLLFTTLACIGFGSSDVNAFPDMIRHGYVNCTACHVSPSGGGLLNSYGRSLSAELMSTWSAAGEEKHLHGLASIPDDLAERYFAGGDVRYISRQSKSESVDVNEGFLMQAQLRAGLAFDELKFLFSLGKIDNPRLAQDVRPVMSEYYFLWAPIAQTHIRGGRFEPIYGSRLPDHNLWIKSELGFVPWSERDGFEFIFEGEKQFASLAGFQSLSNTPTSLKATGFVANYSHLLGDISRIGVSGLNTEGQGVLTKALTLNTHLSFSEKSYSIIEYTRHWTQDQSQELGFLRLGYQIFKGFTPLLQAQHKANQTKSTNQRRLGIGLNWLPRPHWELMGLFEEVGGGNKGTSTEAYLLLHYYL